MPDGSNFRRSPELADKTPTPASAGLRFEFDGRPVTARAGDSVAAALLAAGHRLIRTTPVSGAGRGPFCMMGTCFECLLEIDGEPNRQGCMVEVRDGMRVRSMQGARAFAVHSS